VDFCAISNAKIPDYRDCFRSLQGKKSPNRRFFGVLRAKRNKLPGLMGGRLKFGPVNGIKHSFPKPSEFLEKRIVTIQSPVGDSENRRNEGAFSPGMSRLGAKGDLFNYFGCTNLEAFPKPTGFWERFLDQLFCIY
jgi:hypothetical protein